MTASRLLAAVGIATAITAMPVRARADQTANRALSEALFRDAKNLMAEGDFARACPKLEESHRLDPGGGTLLNLAICHEHEGKTASAWAEFKEALGAARDDGRADRVEIAERHIAALEPKLRRIQIVVDPAQTAGLEVTRNGSQMSAATWGLVVPVDPGTQQIVVRAPGKKPWSVTVEVGDDGEMRSIRVPPLENEPTAVHAPFPTPPGPRGDPGSTRRTVGWVVGGVGAVSLGIGTVFGVRAISKRQESNDHCPSDRCSTTAVSLNEDAKTAATVANVTIGVGLTAIAGGLVLVLTAPRNKAASATLAPAVGPRTGGLLVGGRFH